MKIPRWDVGPALNFQHLDQDHTSPKKCMFGSLPYGIRYIRGARETGMMYFSRTTESSKSQGSYFFACLTAHLVSSIRGEWHIYVHLP